ncbi:AbrB family transcriptional regulator [Nocardia sp. CA2R105]|uniref:AbrB family transcriptional regulator n=1 Tax=Nocardia coffeae TaxID=2873381 RepID=UPI001CA74E59|nr:AbrB family transcriptional regulator [Nocardia coffeae]MBY8858651.1 AbrB family transcriptional regulator [Nocardia coffeae]
MEPDNSRGLAARLRAVSWWRWGLLVAATIVATVALGWVGVQSPALFAGLAVGVVLALVGIGPRGVPRRASTGAQAVIGVTIGVMARPETLLTVSEGWLPVLLVSLGTLLISTAAGLLLGIRRGVTPLTGMLALTAGGATGLVAMSGDLGGDERIVAVIQYLRVGLVTATLPLAAGLASGAVDGVGTIGPGGFAPWYLGLALVVVCSMVGAPMAEWLRIPAGTLLGPMVVALALSLSGWTFGAVPPDLLVNATYAVIGWQAGLVFTREALRTVLRLLPLASVLILGIVAMCAGLGWTLSAATGTSVLDGYLATTPGGLNAVLATATSSGGNVAFVVAVQVIRVILMLVVAPLLARLVGSRLGSGPPACA